MDADDTVDMEAIQRQLLFQSGKESGDVANALYLHFKCHERVERNRMEALEKGWLIRQSDEPILVPVVRMGEWVVLNNDGTYTTINIRQGSEDPL